MKRSVLAATAFVAGAAVWHHRERLNAALDPVADVFENLVDRAEERWPVVTWVLDTLFAIPGQPESVGPNPEYLAQARLYADVEEWGRLDPLLRWGTPSSGKSIGPDIQKVLDTYGDPRRP
jgi:hypothetical protein